MLQCQEMLGLGRLVTISPTDDLLILFRSFEYMVIDEHGIRANLPPGAFSFSPSSPQHTSHIDLIGVSERTMETSRMPRRSQALEVGFCALDQPALESLVDPVAYTYSGMI